MELWRFVFLSLRIFRTHARREFHGHETTILVEFFSPLRLSRPPNFTRSNPEMPENYKPRLITPVKARIAMMIG